MFKKIMEEKFQKIKEIVEKELKYCPAHDIDHVMRVYNLCLSLAENQDVDLEVLKVAALLHDIGGAKELDDSSGKTDHAVLSAEMAVPILEKLGFPKDKTEHIKECIISHRYKTGYKPKTKEAQILFDADKLDAIGAIGIARAFVWIGRNNAKIYKKPLNLDEYIRENLVGGKIDGRIKDNSKHSPQIEFETKTKFLKDKLYTQEGKKMAEERTNFYKKFLDRLEKEINGEL